MTVSIITKLLEDYNENHEVISRGRKNSFKIILILFFKKFSVFSIGSLSKS